MGAMKQVHHQIQGSLAWACSKQRYSRCAIGSTSTPPKGRDSRTCKQRYSRCAIALKAIHLGSHDKIILMQTANLVRKEIHSAVTPSVGYIRMVAFSFG